ncbi:HAD family hydrolase [Candidatus Margulisiibacteriota bacterium]
MIKLVVFDLDGTLVDSLNDIVSSLNFVLGKYNGRQVSVNHVKKFIGLSLNNLIIDSLSGSAVDLSKVREEFLSNYHQNLLQTLKPYNEVVELLQYLYENNIKQCVLTNSLEASARKIISHLGWDKYFEMIVAPDTYGFRKPDPGGLIEILAKYSFSKDEIIMVGDTQADIMVAKAVDIKCISVLYGYQNKKNLIEYQPDYFVSGPREIIPILD